MKEFCKANLALPRGAIRPGQNDVRTVDTFNVVSQGFSESSVHASQRSFEVEAALRRLENGSSTVAKIGLKP